MNDYLLANPQPKTGDPLFVGSTGQAQPAGGHFAAALSGRPQACSIKQSFIPSAPNSFGDLKISEGLLNSILLKYVLTQITATGSEIAEQLRIPYAIAVDIIARLRADQLLVYKGSSAVNDYVYSPEQPYRLVLVGSDMWPTIGLAPGASLRLINVTVSYRCRDSGAGVAAVHAAQQFPSSLPMYSSYV